MEKRLLSTVALLRELVAVNSTSAKSNAPIAAILTGHLENLGFSVRLQRYFDDTGTEKQNVLGLSQPEWDIAPALALVGHTDCVPFDAAWKDALVLTTEEGKLFGRGACDTKGFIACALIAAEAALRRGPFHRPLLLVFTADEEVGCVGAKKLLEENALHPMRAIVGEPTSLTPIRGHKGYCLAEVTVYGKEGHSAYPDSGRSAIFGASRFLGKLEQLSKTELPRQRAADFDPPYTTVNVGLISGGTARNIIPGHCVFTVEWRPVPGQPTHHVLTLLERIREELVSEEPGYLADIRFVREDAGLDTSAQAELVHFLSEQSKNASKSISFGTEAPYLTEMGAESVVFGPGNIQVAHQTGEFVAEAELLRCTEILEAAVLRFCS